MRSKTFFLVSVFAASLISARSRADIPAPDVSPCEHGKAEGSACDYAPGLWSATEPGTCRKSTCASRSADGGFTDCLRCVPNDSQPEGDGGVIDANMSSSSDGATTDSNADGSGKKESVSDARQDAPANVAVDAASSKADAAGSPAKPNDSGGCAFGGGRSPVDASAGFVLLIAGVLLSLRRRRPTSDAK